jgi:hypothetical protein
MQLVSEGAARPVETPMLDTTTGRNWYRLKPSTNERRLGDFSHSSFAISWSHGSRDHKLREARYL